MDLKKKCTQTWLVQCRFRKIQSLKKRGKKPSQTGKIIPLRKVMYFLSVKTYIIWWTVYRVKLSLLPNQQRTTVWISRSLHKKETFYNKSVSRERKKKKKRTLEWVAISFSNAGKWKVKAKSLSRVRLFTTPWTAAYQAPPSMGFSRQEYWSGLPLPSPNVPTSIV